MFNFFAFFYSVIYIFLIFFFCGTIMKGGSLAIAEGGVTGLLGGGFFVAIGGEIVWLGYDYFVGLSERFNEQPCKK